MSLFAIGDLHLSLGNDKPMDIFKGWENYVPRLKENWNNIVTDDDTVVIVGDISWAMFLKEAYDDFNFINNELNGEKIILKGNHDYWFETKTKFERWLNENNFNRIKMLYNNSYDRCGYTLCGTRGWINEPDEPADQKVLNREAGRLRLSLADGKKSGLPIIAFLHYPPVYYINECKEIIDILDEFNIRQCYYGHIHGKGHNYAIDGVYKNIDYHLVSCDYVDFTPVKII